jgi:hypothetical protein
MGYGLSSTSSNNTVQIDSDSPYSYFKTTAQGTASSISLADSTDMLFIKPPSTSTATWGTSYSGGAYAVYADTTATAADYVALRPSRVSSPTTGYGLQVFNLDGQLAFDSGVFISSTSGDKVASVVRVVDVSGAYGNYSTIYTGADYDQVYALINGSYKTNSSFVVLHSFKWDQATTSIKYVSYVAGIFGGGTQYFYNGSSVVLVKLI